MTQVVTDTFEAFGYGRTVDEATASAVAMHANSVSDPRLWVEGGFRFRWTASASEEARICAEVTFTRARVVDDGWV